MKIRPALKIKVAPAILVDLIVHSLGLLDDFGLKRKKAWCLLDGCGLQLIFLSSALDGTYPTPNTQHPKTNAFALYGWKCRLRQCLEPLAWNLSLLA